MSEKSEPLQVCVDVKILEQIGWLILKHKEALEGFQNHYESEDRSYSREVMLERIHDDLENAKSLHAYIIQLLQHL